MFEPPEDGEFDAPEASGHPSGLFDFAENMDPAENMTAPAYYSGR